MRTCRWNRAVLQRVLVLLVALLLAACKSEARKDCERNADSIGANKAACKNL